MKLSQTESEILCANLELALLCLQQVKALEETESNPIIMDRIHTAQRRVELVQMALNGITVE